MDARVSTRQSRMFEGGKTGNPLSVAEQLVLSDVSFLCLTFHIFEEHHVPMIWQDLLISVHGSPTSYVILLNDRSKLD